MFGSSVRNARTDFDQKGQKMTQKLTLQIALMTIVASCLSLVLLVIGSGAGAPDRVDAGQIFPLAIAGAAALVIIIANPFERSTS